MSSSQRSESSHSFLKKYVDRKNSLTDFIARFNRTLVHQRHEELAANHIDLTQTPKVTTALMIENQMVQIYTKKIFLLFQNELIQSNSYICSKRSSSDEAKVYAVQRFEPGRTSDQTRQIWLTRDLLTDARSTFLLSEFQNLRKLVKDIDTGGDVGMSRNRNKSVEETQVICDPNPVRAKGLDNTNQPQYSQDLSDQQYHASDPQYAYLAPNPQYAYHTPDP
ncbi:Protein FAR1-RELATED SEQUENCE [Abeliophyllum distichum]|uniref:Protein FAR1-RELATED SEQUENCE n=1 Tax=Abeliophyllum distichum TaxID=126358 RepID=A0ABD1VQZ9_9LAMI